MTTDRPYVVAGPAAALAHLGPWLDARRERQPVVVLAGDDAAARLLAAPRRRLPRETEAVLVVGPRRRSPATFLGGLFIDAPGGARVPVGWLPHHGPRLATFAAAAARVLARGASLGSPREHANERGAAARPGPVVVLGQWHDRFLRVSARTVRWFEKHGGVRSVHRWTAERIVGPDMVRGLTHGPGLVFYYGHGRERGFAGYHGLRAKHLPDAWPEPVAGFLGVCCNLASRLRTGLSFAEELVLRGGVAGAFAATRKTLHDHNRRLGPALCEALVPGGARTLAELVARAPVEAGILPGPYRFIGDPAVPLLGAAESSARCAGVFAPAPDEPLPPFEVREIELPALAS